MTWAHIYQTAKEEILNLNERRKNLLLLVPLTNLIIKAIYHISHNLEIRLHLRVLQWSEAASVRSRVEENTFGDLFWNGCTIYHWP